MLPDDLRAWLVAGYQGWQQGQDLEGALQLNTPTMDLDERDDLLRVAVRLCPGETETAQMFYQLEVMHGDRTHPHKTGQQFTRMLQGSRVYIPQTVRHLRRVMAGRRHDGWRVGT